MASLRDGMGGEELQISGLQIGGVNISPYFTGSINSASDIRGDNIYGATAVSGVTVRGTTIAGTNISGATTVRAVAFHCTNGSIGTGGLSIAGSVTDDRGRFRSNATGSPSTFGAFVQAGNITTAAGSGATIEFGRQFVTNAYFVTLTAGSATTVAAFVSGGKNVSGCEVVGGASTSYNFIAVGL